MEFERVKKFILAKLKKELSKNLKYHSYKHTMDVYGSAEMLAALEGVTGKDLTLLLTAVLFHDTGFLKAPKEHETTSCEIAQRYLPEYGYVPEDIDKICGMIMATRLPQTPHNKLEEIICDADLDYLGRDDFFKIGNGLYEELCLYGILDNEIDWNKLQVTFLNKHTYFTEAARRLRKPKKDEYIKNIKAKLRKLTAGDRQNDHP